MHINPLSLINRYLANYDVDGFKKGTQELPTRTLLTQRLTSYFQTQHEVELGVDVLIAIGLGRKEEQSATIYCRAEY